MIDTQYVINPEGRIFRYDFSLKLEKTGKNLRKREARLL
jgi:hypothetical protein